MRLRLIVTLPFMLFPLKSYCLDEAEEFFNYSKQVVVEMEKNGELDGNPRDVILSGMLKRREYNYECMGMDFAKTTYERCVTVNDVMRLPDDRGGGFIAGTMVGAGASRVAERVYDRIIDRGLDHAERKIESVRRDMEASDRRSRESLSRERERNDRCTHSTPSIRDGGCP